jgi:hypothetical protein
VNGINAIHELRASGSLARVVFLTIHSKMEFVEACMAEGALGYVQKRHMKAHLVRAIQAALAGQSYVFLSWIRCGRRLSYRALITDIGWNCIVASDVLARQQRLPTFIFQIGLVKADHIAGSSAAVAKIRVFHGYWTTQSVSDWELTAENKASNGIPS